MTQKTALVTGGAGFIGSHMAQRLLDLGYQVIVIDNESTGLRRNVPDGARYYRGDVTSVKDLNLVFENPIDVVLHIAGQASNVRSFDDPLADLTTNTIGTLNILAACLRRKVAHLLFASSMTVYGHPESLPVKESETPRPFSYYGITKYAAERYALATAVRPDLDFKFHVTAFRMFNVYGERQRLDNPYQGALGFFLGSALVGKPIVIHSDGQQTRDFVYIQDVVDAWMAALQTPAAAGEVFNLGFGEGISINRLVDEVLTAAGTSRAAYPLSYGPLRPGDQRHMCADISKAGRILGWQPRTPLDQGLAKTLAWARAEIEAPNA